MKRIFSLLIFFIFFIANCQARYRQTCTVKYFNEDGTSKKYNVDVTFVTGFELNQSTNTYNYDSYSVYGVIFWAKDQATVIKLTSYTTCANEVTKECITNSITDLKGKDQEGRQWAIC